MVFLLTLFAATTVFGPIQERGSFRGAVAIEGAGPDLVVYVDSNHDGSIDHHFRLQRESADAEPSTTLHFPSAHLEFEPRYLRVIAGNDAYEFVLAETQADAWDPRGMRVWRRTGYGLEHVDAGETGVAISRTRGDRSITAEFCDASTDCDPGNTDSGGGGGGGGGGTTLCDSGGPGSTRCSTSGTGGSCSTSCATGYYACCMQGSPPKCRCIRG